MYMYFYSMHVLPLSHGSGVFDHSSSADNHIDYSMVGIPKPDDVRGIPTNVTIIRRSPTIYRWFLSSSILATP